MKLIGFRASSASDINEAISQCATYQTKDLSFLNLKSAYYQPATDDAAKMVADAKMIADLSADALGNDDIVYGVVVELHSFKLFISLNLLLCTIEAAKPNEGEVPMNIEAALWKFLLKGLSSERGLTYEVSPKLKSVLGDGFVHCMNLELSALTNEEARILLGDQ
ncbi:hypothetical protein OTK49_02885 [Vibrio coralliirubri]|uniref:hypothetical protein n=1 Tax=Vibrio coralliirubri TaxID=1516159 RepID=UPI0022837DCE|nr:hypothetical protein [Vibrio coralliirubri]MCY9861464.1 hypothetical protein [Vibrio coralliirubri]